MRAVVVPVLLSLLLSAFVASPGHADDADWLHQDSSHEVTYKHGTVLRNVRFAAHPGFDRVVVDLIGPAPTYYLSYKRTFIHDPTGDHIPIRGASGMAISLYADSRDDSNDDHYIGPRIVRPHLAALKALAKTSDYEGWASFGFALRHRASYRTFVLSNPSRIVIDFRHR